MRTLFFTGNYLRKASLSERKAPLAEREISLSERKAPLSERETPLSERETPLSERKTPLSKLKWPPAICSCSEVDKSSNPRSSVETMLFCLFMIFDLIQINDYRKLAFDDFILCFLYLR